jgi:hypothetical protein
MSESILTRNHEHQTHNYAAYGWRMHKGVEVTEWSTNKQKLSLSNNMGVSRRGTFDRTLNYGVGSRTRTGPQCTAFTCAACGVVNNKSFLNCNVQF